MGVRELPIGVVDQILKAAHLKRGGTGTLLKQREVGADVLGGVNEMLRTGSPVVWAGNSKSHHSYVVRPVGPADRL